MSRSDQSKTEASVLIPVYRHADGGIRIVFILRSNRGVHGDQVAFPGGKRDAEDATALATALREAEEEIGLSADRVGILAELPVAETMTTAILIHPFLARIVRPDRWRVSQDEVAEVIELPLAEVARPDSRREGLVKSPTWREPRVMPFYPAGTHRIWGVTFRILESIIPRLRAGEWQV